MKKNMIILILFVVTPALAAAQARCASALTTATQYYNDARFEEGIALLKHCLEAGAFSAEEQEAVYQRLSMLCFANREEAEARQAMRVLLSLQPDHQPDPVRAQPSYRALMDDVRNEMQQTDQTPVDEPSYAVAPVKKKRRGLKKWLYLGGGAALTSAAFLVFGSTGQSENGGGPKPPPPPPR